MSNKKDKDNGVNLPQSNVFENDYIDAGKFTEAEIMELIKTDKYNYCKIPPEYVDRELMICALDNGLPFHALNTGLKLTEEIDFDVCLAAVRNCEYAANEIPDEYVRPVLMAVLQATKFSKPTTQKIPELNHTSPRVGI